MKVYFKLSKKAFAANQASKRSIMDLTPNKLYEVIAYDGLGFSIVDDIGCSIYTRRNNSIHLARLTSWIKHRPKTNKSNKPKKV